jgi:hypothetical protein
MVPFLTEKQVEAYVALETRDLAMPDGTSRPFTGFNLMWSVFDTLVTLGLYSKARLVEFAVQETETAGVPFDVAFPAVLAVLDAKLRRKYGLS